MLSGLSGNTRLVPKKTTDQVHIPDDGWVKLEYDPDTMQTTWIKLEDDGKATVRITTPQAVVDAMLKQNKHARDNFTGWKGKDGGLVARIPDQLHSQFIKQCGYDPKQGGQYDRKKYAKLLNDIDYQDLRTGGGKL